MLFFRRFSIFQCASKRKISWSPEFVIDGRKGKREVVLSNWKTKKSGKSLRIEKADIEDLEILAFQGCQGFVNTNSLFIKLGATVDEMLPMFRQKTEAIIGEKLSLVAFDSEDRLVGILSCGVNQGPEDLEKVFGPRKEPILEIKQDYGQDIRNGPWGSLNANRYHVLYDSAVKQTKKFLPEGIQKLGIPRVLFVHPEFRSEGIGIRLFSETKKILKNFGCDGWATFAVVDGSRNVTMHPEIGMKILFTFPYRQFRENGIPIFDGLVDGTKEHSVMFSLL